MNSKWEYTFFSDLFEWGQKSSIKSGEGLKEGKYKMYVCSDTEIKRYNEYLEDKPSLIFGTGGKATCHVAFEPFAYSTDCVVAQPKNVSVFLKFYYYYFRRNRLGELQNTFSGSGLQHTSKKKINEIKVPIISKEEQERIVSRIEELFSELDSGIETLKKTKEQLRVYRQAVLKEAFEGKFEKKHLSDISVVVSGYAFKSGKYCKDGKYVVVKIGNVKQWHFDFSRDLTRTNDVDENILDKYLLKKGDCLITLTGSRGKRDYGFVSMIENEKNYLVNQRVAALRFNTEYAIPSFYKYYLSSLAYRNQFFKYETGNVGQGNVGVKALQEPIVICPTKEEQREIVDEIEIRMSVCENIENTVNSALSQAEALRQSILKEAFEGRL